MNRRIPSLDGFRALSIALVLGTHAANSAGVSPAWRDGIRQWLIPDFGVGIFFVISGYLITTLLLAEEEKRGRISLKHFYQRRCLRILPVYFSYVLAVALFAHLSHTSIPGVAYAHALTFTTGFSETGHWTLAHTWSLSVEELFYLVWPLTLVLCPRPRRIPLALAMMIVLPFIRILLYKTGRVHLIELTFFGHWDAIMCGCLAALYQAYHPESLRRLVQFRPAPFRLLAAATLAVLMELATRNLVPIVRIPFSTTLASLATAYLLCSYSLVTGGPVFDFLNSRLVVRVGILSYSLYLWQQIFLYPPKWGYTPQWWQQFPLNVVFAFVAALLSYYVIEQPFLKLKDRLAK